MTDLDPEWDWRDWANCKGLDPELFFPEHGELTSTAKSICRECDVQAECLAFAINSGEKFGIWGGKSERERRAIRQGRAPGRKNAAQCGTPSGYEGHRRRKETPCDPCRLARNAFVQSTRTRSA